MKRIILLLLALSYFQFTYAEELTSDQQKLAWEFIYENLLGRENEPINTIGRDWIGLELDGEVTHDDSTFVIDFIKKCHERAPRLGIKLPPKGTVDKSFDNHAIYFYKPDEPAKNRLSVEERRKSIYYQLFNALSSCRDRRQEYLGMEGCVFAVSDFRKVTFTPFDWFILEKLYAGDFAVQMSQNLSSEAQLAGWKSIRLLFCGKPDDPKVFQGALKVKLSEGFGKEDSTCFYKIFDELKDVISLDIQIVTKDSDANLIYIPNLPGTMFSESSIRTKSGFERREISFNIPTNSKDEQRMKIIYYHVYRSLVHFSPSSVGSQHIHGLVFCEDNADLITYNLLDKFILLKLYSPDFKKQFKEFFVRSYGSSEFYRFKYGELLNNLSIVGSFLIGILILSVLILSKKYRKHNWKFRRFLVQMLCGILVYSLMFFAYFAIKHFSFLTALKAFRGIAVNDVFIVVVSIYIFFVEKGIHLSRMTDRVKLSLVIGHMFVASYLGTVCYSFILDFKDEYSLYIYPLIFALAITTIRIFLISFSAIRRAEIEQKDSELLRLTEKNKQAELQSLRAKINPHFLYNSLNSIASLAHTDAHKTEQMALALSDFFKYAINREQKQLNTLSEELNAVRTYLEIEKVRFGERLSFEIDCPEELLNIQIPQLLIQPLVENAIKHGLSQIPDNGLVRIRVSSENGKLNIRIYDNGPAFPDGPLSGFGIQNTQERIALLYGVNARINWQNGVEKYIEISLPLEQTNISE
jgi:sensor histidine kinase YesM